MIACNAQLLLSFNFPVGKQRHFILYLELFLLFIQLKKTEREEMTMEFTQLTPILAYLSKLAPEHILREHGCSMIFQSQFTIYVEWEEKSDTLSLYTPLLHPSAENRAAFYEELLTAHLFGQFTHNTYFGLHEDNDEIMLFHTSPLKSLDEQQFYELINTFVNQAEYWYRTLPQLQIGQSSADLRYMNAMK
jgi:hypothetical protein